MPYAFLDWWVKNKSCECDGCQRDRRFVITRFQRGPFIVLFKLSLN